MPQITASGAGKGIYESLSRPGLLRAASVQGGRCENTGAPFTAVLGDGWLPRVAVDAVHAGAKDLWKDFGPLGLDTLGRVFSESPVEVTAMGAAYSPESLAGTDVLVVGRLDGPVSEAEQQALEQYLTGGGILLILTGLLLLFGLLTGKVSVHEHHHLHRVGAGRCVAGASGAVVFSIVIAEELARGVAAVLVENHAGARLDGADALERRAVAEVVPQEEPAVAHEDRALGGRARG